MPLTICQVHGERRKEEGPPTLPNNLQAPYRALLDTAKVKLFFLHETNICIACASGIIILSP